MIEVDSRLGDLDRARWRMALTLTSATILIYFGFIALVAFGRPLLALQVVPGSAWAYCWAHS